LLRSENEEDMVEGDTVHQDSGMRNEWIRVGKMSLILDSLKCLCRKSRGEPL
jgi:hypothetical protein